MTIQELAKVIGGLPAGADTVYDVLWAWFEPDYPSPKETAWAKQRADEILENVAKTARLYSGHQ